MKVRIEKTTRDLRRDRDGNDSTRVMFNGEWYSMSGDMRKLYNKTVDVEVKGKWARLVEATPHSNGIGPKIKLSDYEQAMQIFHAAAARLEPDDPQARAALVNTALIALTNGKIELPKDNTPAPFADDMPPPTDEDMPPWAR